MSKLFKTVEKERKIRNTHHNPEKWNVLNSIFRCARCAHKIVVTMKNTNTFYMKFSRGDREREKVRKCTLNYKHMLGVDVLFHRTFFVFVVNVCEQWCHHWWALIFFYNRIEWRMENRLKKFQVHWERLYVIVCEIEKWKCLFIINRNLELNI